MPAIITNKFRVHNAKSFISSALKYYMFIGRPHSWTDDQIPDTPKNNASDSISIWDEIISMKLIDKESYMSHGISKRIWTSGKFYDIYRHDYGTAGVSGVNIDTGAATTPTDLSDAKYYVISGNDIYICVSNGNGTAAVASTIDPATLVPDANMLCKGGVDTYVWKKVATGGVSDIIKFATTDYFPVKTLSVDPVTGDYASQWDWQVQSGTDKGAIFNFKLTAGGTGYGANLVNQAGIATVKGDGAGCTVGVFTDGDGAITKLQVNNIGSGYTWANITFITGTSAAATAIISPPKGLGVDPVSDLNAFNIITNVRFEYADGDDFPVTNDYRRIGMIVNPAQYGAPNTPLATSTASAMLTLKITAGWTGTWAADQVIEDATTKARGRIVDVNDGTGGDVGKKILRVIRTQEENAQSTVTNAAFVAANVLNTVPGGSASGTISEVVAPEVEPDSGEMVYIENRRPIMRSIDQIEDIKLVLEF